jgi:uncharacterized protein (TIGR03083 family)
MADLVAAYAIDATEPDDDLLVEAVLAGSQRASNAEQAMRMAGATYASAILPDSTPPARLRDGVLTAAFSSRTGHPLAPTSPAELHRLETERMLVLLRRLDGEQWNARVDPAELAGWTVRDLAIHVLSNESLLARNLGITEPIAPEPETGNVPRTDSTNARLAHAPMHDIIEEYESFVRAVDLHASMLDDAQLDHDIDWWGSSMRISTVLIVRTFETWTHADDIRRALGIPHVAPTAPELAAMSTRSTDWIPLIMASTGDEIEPSIATLVLSGPGGGHHTVELGLEPAPAGESPRFEVEIDIIDYCRAIANRVPSDGLTFEARGDVELAKALTERLPSLAGV